MNMDFTFFSLGHIYIKSMNKSYSFAHHVLLGLYAIKPIGRHVYIYIYILNSRIGHCVYPWTSHGSNLESWGFHLFNCGYIYIRMAVCGYIY